jgi:hypothetical protein
MTRRTKRVDRRQMTRRFRREVVVSPGDRADIYCVIYRLAERKIRVETVGLNVRHAIVEGRRILGALCEPVSVLRRNPNPVWGDSDRWLPAWVAPEGGEKR